MSAIAFTFVTCDLRAGNVDCLQKGAKLIFTRAHGIGMKQDLRCFEGKRNTIPGKSSEFFKEKKIKPRKEIPLDGENTVEYFRRIQLTIDGNNVDIDWR